MWKIIEGLLPNKTEKKGSESGPISIIRKDELRQLEATLAYSFNDIRILDRALTHRSYTHEVSNMLDAPSYESLEFLGDAILGFLIGEKLFLSYQNLSEGELSKIRSYLVSTRRLARLSADLNLGDYLHLSQGEKKTGGRKKTAILADLFESVSAAVYLDGGIDAARKFVLNQFQTDFERLMRGEITYRDPKSQLQELLHREALPSPEYRIVKEAGPDHRKEFEVTVSSRNRILGSGSGRSKKEAEKAAAREAIFYLHNSTKS